MTLFQNNLKFLRKQKGLRQSDLSELVDITRTTLSNYENGVSNPDSEALKKLALVFEVSIDSLINSDLQKTFPSKPKENIVSENEVDYFNFNNNSNSNVTIKNTQKVIDIEYLQKEIQFLKIMLQEKDKLLAEKDKTIETKDSYIKFLTESLASFQTKKNEETKNSPF